MTLSSILVIICIILLVFSGILILACSRYKIKFDQQMEKNQILQQENTKLEVTVQYQEKVISEFDKLRTESKEVTKAALFELGSDLTKQLIETHRKETLESKTQSENRINETTAKFHSEFERIVSMVGRISKDVDRSNNAVESIKSSLLSPGSAGQLAEITLENILKNSGLRANIDFSMQYTVSGENYNLVRPDAVVFLPSNNLMVIDAKSSKFLLDCDDKLLAKTMNNHLKSLSSKEYANLVSEHISNESRGNVITLMFLPTEQAVEKIIESDKDFLNKAWQNNIFPVGPAGIMNMLSFAKFQITEEMMLNNYKDIMEEVKKLISSVGVLSDYSAKLGNNIAAAASNYDKFAASFNRNFLSKAKSIARLGLDVDVGKLKKPLGRYQIISGKSELIEAEINDEEK